MVVRVRETTRSDTILLETGMLPIKHIIQITSKSFVKKRLGNDKFANTPLDKIFKMCEEKQTKGYRCMMNILNNVNGGNDDLKQKFTLDNRTKAETYRQINPLLNVHQVYKTDNYIDEKKRIVFTQFRLSSHNLRIETGRWARIERENRLCTCGVIQDEFHVLFDCTKTADIRVKYNVNKELYHSIGDLMNTLDPKDLVDFVYDCLQQY